MSLISPRIIEWSFFGVNAYLNADTGKIAYSHEKMTRKQLLSIKGFAAPRFIPRVSSKYEVYTLCFRVSSACNLHCSYCFRKKDCPKPAEKVSDVSREIGRFLSKAKHCKRLFVDLSGDAEPLLAIDEILKVAAFCDAKEKESGVDIVVQFVCNGTLLTEDAVSKLQKAGILFGVSLDGAKAQHDGHRVFSDGSPTYDLIINNIRNIKNREFLGLSMTIGRDFDGDLLQCYLEMAALCQSVSVRFARDFCPLRPFDMPEKVVRGYDRLTDYLIEAMKRRDYKLLRAILNSDDKFGAFFLRVLTGLTCNCPCEGLVARFAYVGGAVYPCIPCATEEEFKTADFFEPHVEFSGYPVYADPCKRCECRFFCGGECPLTVRKTGCVDRFLCLIKKAFLVNSIKMVSYLSLDKEANGKVLSLAFERLSREKVDPICSPIRSSYMKGEKTI